MITSMDTRSDVAPKASLSESSFAQKRTGKPVLNSVSSAYPHLFPLKGKSIAADMLFRDAASY